MKKLLLVHIGLALARHPDMEKGIGDAVKVYDGEVVFADELTSYPFGDRRASRLSWCTCSTLRAACLRGSVTRLDSLVYCARLKRHEVVPFLYDAEIDKRLRREYYVPTRHCRRNEATFR